jgi:hypothetical protein
MPLLTPAQQEADARARWGSLDPAPVVAADAEGRRLTLPPSGMLVPILRRARLIAASTSLCEAVVAHLDMAGVVAAVDQVRAEPGVADELAADGRGPVQVMAVRAGDRLVPVRPGATRLRVWPVQDGIELSGAPSRVGGCRRR